MAGVFDIDIDPPSIQHSVQGNGEVDDDVIEDIEIKDDLYRHGPDFKALNSSLMSEPG